MNQHVPTDQREEQQQVRADDGYAQRERRFRQLYEEHYLHIQAYAVRRVDVRADVADVVAEVFTTAWRRLDDVPPAGLTLSSLPGGTHSAGTAIGHPTPSSSRTSPMAILTAKQVLDTAATSALSHPGATPRPDQFIYTKVGDGGGHVAQTWLSVDGSRNGLMEDQGPNGKTTMLGCVNGERKIRLPGYNGKPYTGPAKPKAAVPLDGPVVTEPCTPQPAFLPAMPTTASAMPAYLAKTQGVRLNDINDVAKVVEGIFQSDYLLPAQRAALYKFLATTPGLTLERNVKDVTGRPGIGVGWSFQGSKAMLIFDPSTYTLLGVTTRGEKGEVGGAALLQMAITNQAGQ